MLQKKMKDYIACDECGEVINWNYNGDFCETCYHVPNCVHECFFCDLCTAALATHSKSCKGEHCGELQIEELLELNSKERERLLLLQQQQ